MTVMSEGLLLNSKYMKMGREEGVFKLKNILIFSCSGEFRDVPGCSMFRILWTPC